MRKILVFLMGLLMMAGTGHADAAAIGVSWWGDVWSINETAGSATLIGASGFTRLNSLARNSAGEIFTASHFGELIKIDPNDGSGLVVADLFGFPTNYSTVRALAFSSDDSLFAIVDEAPTSNFVGLDALYRVDVGTGAMTRIGGTGLWGVQGLDFYGDGTLYGWDVGYAFDLEYPRLGLVTIDVLTGAVSDVNPDLSNGDAKIQTLAFSLDGINLYGAGSGLFSMNRLDGSVTAISAWEDVDLRGMVPVPASTVSEPATMMLLGLGLLGLAGTRDRR